MESIASLKKGGITSSSLKFAPDKLPSINSSIVNNIEVMVYLSRFIHKKGGHLHILERVMRRITEALRRINEVFLSLHTHCFDICEWCVHVSLASGSGRAAITNTLPATGSDPVRFLAKQRSFSEKKSDKISESATILLRRSAFRRKPSPIAPPPTPLSSVSCPGIIILRSVTYLTTFSAISVPIEPVGSISTDPLTRYLPPTRGPTHRCDSGSWWPPPLGGPSAATAINLGKCR
ncbi:hypothetical protein AVEN_249394-1 [Araneus ventricosus]|uniref:Uncharacterized protein n=1 Tax=Araneus ventricosus TaxID=182803 RepID=A0A4Y2ICJ6_ARAVE|nr:hypothetical protein AVEN_249394-1 [Araneus ventricosus]